MLIQKFLLCCSNVPPACIVGFQLVCQKCSDLGGCFLNLLLGLLIMQKHRFIAIFTHPMVQRMLKALLISFLTGLSLFSLMYTIQHLFYCYKIPSECENLIAIQ